MPFSSTPSTPRVTPGSNQDGVVQLIDRTYGRCPPAVQLQCARSNQATQSGDDIRNRPGRRANSADAFDDVVARVDGPDCLDRLYDSAFDNAYLKGFRLAGPPVVVRRLAAAMPAIDARSAGGRGWRKCRSASNAPGSRDVPGIVFLPDTHAPKVRRTIPFRHRRNSESSICKRRGVIWRRKAWRRPTRGGRLGRA